jgi:hypothetical protein
LVVAATIVDAFQKLNQIPGAGGTKRRKLEEGQAAREGDRLNTARRRRTATAVRNAHGCSSSETRQRLAGIQLQLFDIV